MKYLNLLRGLTKVLFVICMIVALLSPGFIILHFISPGSIPPNIKISIKSDFKVFSIIMMILMVGGLYLFVYCLYLFRQLLDLFAKHKIFHTDTIKMLRSIGKYILIALLMAEGPVLLSEIINNEAEITLSGFTLKLVTAILGLFFIVLSEVFLIAKNIKEENDLTV